MALEEAKPRGTGIGALPGQPGSQTAVCGGSRNVLGEQQPEAAGIHGRGPGARDTCQLRQRSRRQTGIRSQRRAGGPERNMETTMAPSAVCTPVQPAPPRFQGRRPPLGCLVSFACAYAVGAPPPPWLPGATSVIEARPACGFGSRAQSVVLLTAGACALT